MSSENASPARTETSLDIFKLRNSKRFLHFGRNDSQEDTTPRLFPSLNVFHDIPSRSAALNMATDEALPKPQRFRRFVSINGIIQRFRSDILGSLRKSQLIPQSAISFAAGPAAELFFMGTI